MNQCFDKEPEGIVLSVRHKTLFHYLIPVRDSTNTLHLEPRNFLFQKTLSSFIKVIPATRLQRFEDLFRNITHHFEISGEHQVMQVESLIKVRTLPLSLTHRDYTDTLACYEDQTLRERCFHYLCPSQKISQHSEAWRQAIDLCEGKSAVFEKAQAIMQWIHSEFRYAPGLTQVETSIDEALRMRAGVCQDFTHIMIAMCRGIGIPARYASGYLYTGGNQSLLGAQASHAWCEVYLPETGWIGFDPTNAVLADQRYVKIAIGRDYEDVAPLRGYYYGGSNCRMEVNVSVERI